MRQASFLFMANSKRKITKNKIKDETYQVDKNGYYGEFGGAYVPEILHQCVENLQNTYLQVLESDSSRKSSISYCVIM